MLNLSTNEFTILEMFRQQDWDLTLLQQKLEYQLEYVDWSKSYNKLININLIERDPDIYACGRFRLTNKGKSYFAELDRQYDREARQKMQQWERQEREAEDRRNEINATVENTRIAKRGLYISNSIALSAFIFTCVQSYNSSKESVETQAKIDSLSGRLQRTELLLQGLEKKIQDYSVIAADSAKIRLPADTLSP